ncbi:hypothetical protein TRFO_38663 [Tritrichomonas foetus]|uniref:Protein kinase domain-containing protein n=1 Tax=Tritrichomonas foetus TaxID=1144522 RepID=A0A1J4J7A4_9EUKA|nr:hypothetical protein TRFO_38663 [Tritrichomonas foetus]|eukprot:OHS95114.1 hypothetical protein TRFO_38663 [Tritrichomonas foetus]
MSKQVNLDDFELLKTLGIGSYGSVFLCRHKKSGKLYAAKEIRHVPSSISESPDKDDREISILSQLNHPCIVGFEGYSETDFQGDSFPVILTELLSGGNLMEAIEREQTGRAHPDWDNTRKQIILIGTAVGMKYLHDNNIIHRDLKPGNVMLDENQYPHIIDFGLSKFIDPSESIKMSINSGTLFYMAPELFDDDEKYNFPVDVYAFGILAYEVLMGASAYPEKEIAIFKHAGRVRDGIRPVFTEKIPDTFQDFLNQCWDTNPSNRFNFDEIVVEILTNPSLVLPDVDYEEYFNYCKNVLNVIPSNIPIANQSLTKKARRSTDFSRTTIDANHTKTKTIQIKVPKRRAPPIILSPDVNTFSTTTTSATPNSMKKVGFDKNEKPDFSRTDIGIRSKRAESLPATAERSAIPSIKIKVPQKKKFNPIISTFQYSSKEVQPSDTKPEEDKKVLITSEKSNQLLKDLATTMPADLSSFLRNKNIHVKDKPKTTKKEAIKNIFDLTQSIRSDASDPLMLTTSITGNIDDIIELTDLPSNTTSADMLFKIGNIYEKGSSRHGINFQKALLFYKAASDKGHAEATFNYASFLLNGVGVDKEDLEGALKYFKLACERGCQEAYVNYGALLYNGGFLDDDKETEPLIEKNIPEALKWLSKSAEENQNETALYYAGLILGKGYPPEIPEDHEKAAEYLLAAAKKGSRKAAYALLKLLIESDQVDMSISCLKLLAEKNIDIFQFLYGVFTYETATTEEEYTEGLKYIKLAAENNFLPAMEKLYPIYYEGNDYLESDPKEELYWLSRAANHGSTKAKFYLGRKYLFDDDVEGDMEKGIRYLTEAVDEGFLDAAVYLLVAAIRNEDSGIDFNKYCELAQESNMWKEIMSEKEKEE